METAILARDLFINQSNEQIVFPEENLFILEI